MKSLTDFVTFPMHQFISLGFLRGCWARVIVFVWIAGYVPLLSAAIIGTNTPAPSLSRERIDTLPPSQQAAWKKYLNRSEHQRQADQHFLLAEMHRHGVKTPMVPPSGFSARSIPLNQPAIWYGSAEASRIASIIVSFQTPAGGWSKNLNLKAQPRVPGESFAPDNYSRFPGSNDFDSPPADHWDYVGTFDNDATITELRFLARVIAAGGKNQDKPFSAAFERGLNYIFAAQYPNGGWPQVWPLQGGYHDAITYNDNAMINVLNLLHDVSADTNEFGFVPEKTRRLAAAGCQRGVACILASQIVVDGHRTVWCQQHDALTLQPVSARNYEMPSETSSESADIVLFLMAQPHPDREIAESVNAAAAWFVKNQIRNMAFAIIPGQGRQLVSAPDHGPIWARYYQIGTDRPIFGDRNKTIHDHLDEITPERRNGYSWYTEAPQNALARYAHWKQVHSRF